MFPFEAEFYRIQKLPPYVFAVVNEMKARLRAAQLDVVDLGMGNPDGATPRAVVSKLVEAARNPRNHRYSASRGIPRLREEIVKRYQAHYGVELDANKEAIVTMGAKDALAHLLFAVIGPGDVVVSPNPCYPIHQYGVVMAEGRAEMLPMPDPGTFLEGLESLYRGPGQKPKLILISFPHNPTTQCVEVDFFREVIGLAARHGTMVVHDFAYADICFDGYRAPSILQVEGAREVAVEIFSMSKSYNMAGWRVGFCVGNAKMIAALARISANRAAALWVMAGSVVGACSRCRRGWDGRAKATWTTGCSSPSRSPRSLRCGSARRRRRRSAGCIRSGGTCW